MSREHSSFNNAGGRGVKTEKRKKMTAKRRKKIIVRRLIFAALIIILVVGILIFKKNSEMRAQDAENKVEAFINRGMTGAFISSNEKKYNEALASAQIRQRENEERKVSEAAAMQEQAFKDGCVHFVAVGDNLIHERVYSTADINSANWNYDELYANIKPYIEAADIAAVNQETPFVADHTLVSGYPSFGTPVEIGDALINAGFDVFTFATNHAYDKGDYGILTSIAYGNLHPDKTFLGIHESEEAAEEIKVVEAKGIKIAMLNYTTSVNNESESAVRPFMIDRSDPEKISSDVARAKELSDFVIVFLHDGEEYVNTPSDSQRYYESICLESGADVLICSHSHVLEGYNIETSSTGHKMLVYYGLGNFISSQDSAVCLLGGMADFYIKKDENTGICSIYYEDLVPLITHYNAEQTYYTVYRVQDYSDELAYQHGISTVSGEAISMDWLNYYGEYARQVLYY